MDKDDVKKIMSKISNWYLGTRKLHALLWGERPSDLMVKRNILSLFIFVRATNKGRERYNIHS
jgi:hypothetical protein